VDQVREQRDRPGGDEDHGLDGRRDPEHAEADRDGRIPTRERTIERRRDVDEDVLRTPPYSRIA
jgi:hypothetical protein